MPTIAANSGAYSIIGANSITAWALACAVGSYALTGTSATLIRGYQVIADSGSYALVGTAVTTPRITAEPAGYLIDGQPVGLLLSNPFVSAVSGTYTLTGSAAILEKAIAYNRGDYLYSGVDATLSRSSSPTLGANSGSYVLTAGATVLQAIISMDTGDYGVTGNAATLSVGEGIPINSGTYSITNPSVALLKRAQRFTASNTVYTLAGQAATLLRFSGGNAVQIAAEGYFYTLTGSSVSLRNTLNAASGSYVLTGIAAELMHHVGPGSYALTGTDVTFQRTSIVSANSGLYAITGNDATLLHPTVAFSANSGTYTIAGLFSQIIRLNLRLEVSEGFYTIFGSEALLLPTQIGTEEGVYSIIGLAADLRATRTGRWRTQPSLVTTTTQQTVGDTTWESQSSEPGIGD